MAEFCPHCGEIGGLVWKGQALFCSRCGKQAGVILPVERQVVNEADELIRQGVAAHCPVCQQLVELRAGLLARHYATGSPRKVCAGSAKPAADPSPARPAAGGKDLSAYMTRETIRVVSCRKGDAPRIEELSLAYLDKRDRVRVQIEALRDILGANFRMGEYPAVLNRPQLMVWTAAAQCVVGKRYDLGGYQSLTDAELAQVVADLQQHAERFFA